MRDEVISTPMSDTHIYINHSGASQDGEGGPGTANTTAKKDALKSKLKGMTGSMAKQAPQAAPSGDDSLLSQFDQNMHKTHGTPSGRVPGGLPVGFNPDEMLKQLPKYAGGTGDMDEMPPMKDYTPIFRPSGPSNRLASENNEVPAYLKDLIGQEMPASLPTQADMLSERERYMKDVRNMQNQKVMSGMTEPMFNPVNSLPPRPKPNQLQVPKFQRSGRNWNPQQ